jgi:hypothetical protein
MLAMARSDGLPASQLDAFEAWLPANRVEQKRADALELIRELRQLDSHQPEPFRPQFTLASSSFLERLLDRAE